MGGGELAEQVRVGTGKEQAGSKKTSRHSRSDLDLLSIGCICHYLVN